jgi:hypothetical protein
MALDFPNSPVSGQVFNPGSGQAWQWDGTKWIATGVGGAATGSLVYLGTLTANNSAQLDFVGITSGYDAYLFEIVNIVPVNDGGAGTNYLQALFQVGGTFQTTNYQSVLAGAFGAGVNGVGSANETDSTGVQLSGYGTNLSQTGNTAGMGVNGQVWLHAPNGTTNYKNLTGTTRWRPNSAAAATMNTAAVGGQYVGSTGAVTGVRFKMFGANNISTGQIRVYGLITSGGSGSTGAVRYDAAQNLTTPQQAVALQNIGASQFNLVNGKLVESHAANAATFAIKALDGNDPSPSNPVFCMMPDYTLLTLTAALALTIPSASRIGTRNGQPFRLWFALASTGGTPKLVVRRCSDFVSMAGGVGSAAIAGFPAIGSLSTTALPGNNAFTNYCDAAFSGFYRVIAFADYDSGLATAGTWVSSPTRIVPVGPKTPQPGEIVQHSMASKGAASTTSNAWVNSGLQVTITPTCVCNYFNVRADFDSYIPSSATQPEALLARNTPSNSITNTQVGAYTNAGTASYTSSGLSCQGMDAPFTIASTTYMLAIASSVVGNSISHPANFGSLLVDEIMA